MKTIASIQQIFYAEPMTAAPLSGAAVKAILNDSSTKQINNVHSKTWAYEEQEGTNTPFINQLNGQTYYNDTQPGTRAINFTIGQYEYETKADLQGGTATSTSWKAPTNQGIINKCFIGRTKDDTYVVFPKAQISCRTGMVESTLMGLMLTATPIETGITGLETEAWFDASEVA